MTNNDIFRRLRYIFNLSDEALKETFALVSRDAHNHTVRNWLKKDDDPEQIPMPDIELAAFLNGIIIRFRGRREGPLPIPEQKLTHNAILRKLKIALCLQADDMLEIWKIAQFRLSKHELSAFFRKPTHKHYRVCKDQILRNFLQGLALKNRHNGKR